MYIPDTASVFTGTKHTTNTQLLDCRVDNDDVKRSITADLRTTSSNDSPENISSPLRHDNVRAISVKNSSWTNAFSLTIRFRQCRQTGNQLAELLTQH